MFGRLQLVWAVGLAWSVSAEVFEFPIPAEARTAVVFGEMLDVVALDAADVYRVDVPPRPLRRAGGVVEQVARKPFVVFRSGRLANVAAHAHVTVSSRGDASKGFQPVPGLNEPSSLVDGKVHDRRNFAFANRQTPPSPAEPDWIVLDWKREFPLAGLFLMTGRDEALPMSANIHVARYVGKGDPRLDVTAANWKPVPGGWTDLKAEPDMERRGWSAWSAESPVTGRAFRLAFAGPAHRVDGRGETPVASLGEIAVLMPWTGAQEARAKRPVKGSAMISFVQPFDGTTTIQVRDAQGRVVANPVTGEAFDAGSRTASWDLTDIDGNVLLKPGTYSWRGVAVPPLRLDYRYAYYPLGLPDDRRPWMTEDRTGGWLADHDPPRGVVRDGENMWLNAWAECGDSVIRTDLEMRKQWGQTRFWVAVPQEICVDGGFVYGYSQGGWNGTDEEIIRIDPACGYQSKKVFLKKNPREEGSWRNAFFGTSVTGFQVLGDTAFVSLGGENRIAVYDISKGNAARARPFSWADVHTQFEELKPVLLKEIVVTKPGRLRRYGTGRLVTTSGRDVLALDVKTCELRKLFSVDFDAALGLGVGDDGTIWIGAGEPWHQVFGYDARGRKVKTLGKPGKRKVGPWDDDDLEEPAGVEVDARGRVWVAEHTHWEKRVSVWNAQTAHCEKQVLGPTQYGGDGCIDPDDETRLFYRGLELHRDPGTGVVKPVNLIYRPDAPDYPRFAASDYPSYCFRAKGRLWFTSFQYPHGHPQCVLWRYDQDHVRPVAAVGAIKDYKDAFGGRGSITNCVPGIKAEPGSLYTWTDRNGNGRIDVDEVKTGRLSFAGNPIPGLGVGWNWRMNERFEIACMTDVYKLGRMVYFRPSGATPQDDPIYDVPTETVSGVLEAQGLQTDARGNVIALGRYVASLCPDGTERWRYRNQWPGLHAGHRTTAAGSEPGVLIAPTRMWGVVPTAGEAGEVAAFNSNLGCAYLMTAEDGLYLGRVFRDQRVAPTLWNMNDVPDATTMAETSLHDEHFGGTFQLVKGRDGRGHYYYVVGKGHCAVVELTGLDAVKRLAGGTIAVTAEMIAAAQRRVAEQAAARLEPKVLDVAHGRPVETTPAAENVRLGVDAGFLYVSSQWRDDRAPFANAGENPFELFKSGDTLEVMLRTQAAGNARGVQPGDIRLVFAPYRGKPICVLYDYRRPDRKAGGRVGFSSPWRTVWVDCVQVLESVEVEVTRKGAAVRLEAKVPLKEIHFTPCGDVKGDVGRVLSDATGTRASARTYWSNKNTAIMSDLPTEVGIEPDLWGTFRFGKREP